MKKREILVPTTKTGIPRVLFFSEETKVFMERVWSPQEMANEAAMLFESKRVALQPIAFKRHWLWLVSSIGRPDLRMHDLRHHRAKQMLDKGPQSLWPLRRLVIAHKFWLADTAILKLAA